MKRVLILAYDFPPFVSVGGLRPYSWLHHLREFGIEPIVVTRQWSNNYGNHLDYVAPSSSKQTIIETTDTGTVLRCPYTPNLPNKLLLKYENRKFRLLRKALTATYEVLQFLLPVGPKRELYLAADAYLRTNKVDTIIATGEPFVLFHYASLLSEKHGIPWIADYRDPWSQSKARSRFGLRLFNEYMERRALRKVQGITTVSKFIARHIETNVKGKTIKIIVNGYDNEAIEGASHVQQSRDKFVIAFAGTVYKWHPVESFLRACQDLLASGEIPELEIRFYGLNDQTQSLEQIVDSSNTLSGAVRVYPRLPNNELALELGHANVFLLFNDHSILGTKIFTYLGLKRQILLCYLSDKEALELKQKHFALQEFPGEAPCLQADLMKKTHSGLLIRDSEHLRETLRTLYSEFTKTQEIACSPFQPERFSRRLQARELAEWLKALGS